MNSITKTIVTIFVTTAIVSILMYFFGFAMLFTHTAVEAFYYAGVFLVSNSLVLGIQRWLSNRSPRLTTSSPGGASITAGVGAAA